MWRVFLGYFMSAAFFTFGVVVAHAAISFGLNKGSSNDIIAGSFMGSLIIFCGGIVLFVALKTKNKYKQAKLDANDMMAATLPHAMNLGDETDLDSDADKDVDVD